MLGFYDGTELICAGRVGTGFTSSHARELWQRLQPLRRAKPPFADGLPAGESRKAVWVEPELVAETEYRGWTSDGLLRHASYKGLREDKDPHEVIRE